MKKEFMAPKIEVRELTTEGVMAIFESGEDAKKYTVWNDTAIQDQYKQWKGNN